MIEHESDDRNKTINLSKQMPPQVAAYCDNHNNH